VLVALLEEAQRTAPLDIVAGPSGYGLPVIAARDLTETDLRLAYLAAEGESGGIGGLRSLMRRLARSSTPVVLTPPSLNSQGSTLSRRFHVWKPVQGSALTWESSVEC
jgi:predicted butyrate kinase (DUF1464 family)